MANNLQFNNDYWEDIFGTNKPKFSLDERLHLAFFLLIFLNVSIAQFLTFMITCKINEVRNQTARFMGYSYCIYP